MTYAKDANEIAAEYERRERLAKEPGTAVPTRRGSLSVFPPQASPESAPMFEARDVLISFQDRTIIATYPNGDLEFFVLPEGATAYFERDSAEQ